MPASFQYGMQATLSNDPDSAAQPRTLGSKLGPGPGAFSPQTETPSVAKLHDDQGDRGHQVELIQGPEFPGAYPGPIDAPDVFTASDAKNTALGVLQAAKHYIPTQHGVEKAVLTVSEKVKQYLPNIVTSHLPLVSFESQGNAREVAAGIDCAHVADNQSGMARLLNEDIDIIASAAAEPTHVPNDVDHDSTISRYNTGSKTLESNSITNLRTQAKAGSAIEATLSSSTTPIVTPLLRSSSVSVDTQLLKDTTPLGNPDLVLDPINDSKSPKIPYREDVLPGSGDDTCRSERAMLPEIAQKSTVTRIHPLAEQDANRKGVSQTDSPGSSESELSASVKESGGTHSIEYEIESSAMVCPGPPAVDQRDGSTSSNDSVTQHSNPNSKIRGSPRRSKFMDKIKGEMKMISGKLAHNEEKIEEGRRLMGKAE